MENKKNLKSITTQLPLTSLKTTSTTPYILNGEFYEILSQEGEGVTVRCRKCPGDNIYKGSVKSTGNFHMHIKRKHSELLPRVHEMKLKSFTERKFKMPQRKQLPYNNNGRKLIKNEKYQTKLLTEVQQNFDENNLQTEPIDYRKKSSMIDNDMIITKIHNPIHKFNSFPIITTQSNQQHYLFSPPPAHQSSFECIKAEHTSVQDEIKERNTDSFNDNKMIMESDNSTIINNQNLSTVHQPLEIISNPMPLITTASAIPGHDVLLRVENHLKGIEREMRIRNQIESNRIYLDFAKFKFLHPNFTLQN